jgi:hypothetical protein
MNIRGKSAVLGALVFTAFLSSAKADEQIAQGAGAAAAVTLPGVTVVAPRKGAEHYAVPVGYDSNVWLHPYTSGLGPCLEGATPSQGCHHPTGNPIPPSHYERAPFNQ